MSPSAHTVDHNTRTVSVPSWEPIHESRAVTMSQVLVPAELLTRYIETAMGQAVPKILESGAWFADLPGFPGVWAEGTSPKECLDTLADVLREWVFLKIVDQDQDLPRVDELDLTVLFSP